jgi:serine/threonine-protein kinase
VPDEPRVQQLLDELFDREATPEEVCGVSPELLPVVRERWRQICRARAELDVLLPYGQIGSAPMVRPEDLPLPQVPGYQVEAVLGHGGMGVVFRARHLRLGRVVALKMALSGSYADSHEKERFRREAEAVAPLRHPNVVQVYDVGDADGRPYFTMELMDGGSLARKLAGAPQPPREAAALLATLSGALQAAHQAGLVHRDLKPGNVLLTADGTPKVADFGLARRLDADERLTLSGAVIGTPSYAAPEQARGDRGAVGPRTDVYALGAILYECLTGRPPFHAGTAAATLQQVVADEPIAPRRLNPSVPRDLETVCMKCLHKEPRQRYSSAAELADDLQRFERGEPIAARRIGVVGSLWKWARRRPAAAAMLAAVTLLAAIGIVGAGLLYQHGVQQARTDQEVLGIVDRARGLLDVGWQAHNLAELTEAEAEGIRAADIARSGGASAHVQQEAARFREDAALRLDRAAKNRALLEELLDVSATVTLVQPGADEQYAAAFRRWGLDVDSTAEADVAERLCREPDVVIQELIAGLDAWMVTRRSHGRPEAEWKRLFRVADRLDLSERHRRLRALLVGDSPPPAATVAALAGAGASWPALWELTHGTAWRSVREMRREIDPRTAPVLTVVLLARAFATAGDAPGAEQVLRQAAATRPDQVVVLNALGKLLERQGPARLAEAIGYYRAARSLRRHLGINLSRALLAAGRPLEAEEVLQDLVNRQPDNPAIYFCLGTAAHELRRYGEAQTAFRKAIDLKPDFAEAYSNLGNTLSARQRYREAEAELHKAVDLKPDFAEAHNNLGNALTGRQRYGEAEAAYRKAIELRPDLAKAHNNLGTALDRQQRSGEAEAAYRKAIELRPDFAEAHNNLGTALDRQHRSGEAEAAYRKAIELRPDYALAYHNLGIALMGQQRPGEAEAAFRKTIDLNPRLYEAYHNLAIALMQQARFDETAAALKRAGELLPAKDSRRAQAWKLQQQCERLRALDARLPAVLQGTEKPVDARNQLEFACLCTLKKQYAAGARLYADALTTDPQLAEELRAGFRYNAACAAALAGGYHGEDGTEPSREERARWRDRARRWLRADLAAWAKVLYGDPTGARQEVRQRLNRWRADPDLAGLREPAELDKLTAAERKECLALWAEVGAVLARCGEIP